jgi:hypothetical protein
MRSATGCRLDAEAGEEDGLVLQPTARRAQRDERETVEEGLSAPLIVEQDLATGLSSKESFPDGRDGFTIRRRTLKEAAVSTDDLIPWVPERIEKREEWR